MANGYTKIAAGGQSGRLSATRVSLWRAADHLLLIDRDYYTEKYKRFYFADLETFSIRKDNRQRTYAFLAGSTVFILLVIAFITSGVARGIFLGTAGFFLIPFIYNWAKGPTCVVHITTAVQREEIPSLRRVRKAEKVLAQVMEGVAASQGILTAEAARAQFEIQRTVAPPIVPTFVPPPPLPPPPLPG
jgi:hypothetical protein